MRRPHARRYSSSSFHTFFRSFTRPAKAAARPAESGVGGWVFQFIGHAAEGKPPEFFRDWRFLFVGLRWWGWRRWPAASAPGASAPPVRGVHASGVLLGRELRVHEGRDERHAADRVANERQE